MLLLLNPCYSSCLPRRLVRRGAIDNRTTIKHQPMKVVFTDSPTGAPYRLGYSAGDTAEVPDAVGQALIEDDMAVPISEAAGGAAAGAKNVDKKPAAPASEKATSKRPAKAEKATKK